MGTVGVADKKGVDFRDRVKFKNSWLNGVAHGLYHPSDQGDASLELTFEYKLLSDGGEKAFRVFLLVSPWLSYSCSIGARFLLRKPGEAEGRAGTIQRLLGDDRCALRVDGESKETLLDPRPDTAIPRPGVRHAPGTHVLYLAGTSCVDAMVEEMPLEEWNKGSRRRQRGMRLPDVSAGTKHWLRVQTEGHTAAGKLIEADLNLTNHCVQHFATAAAYEEARLLHCADIVARERHVEDAITGNTLDIAEQLVDVSTQEGVEGSINRLGETITNVKDLARILRKPDEHRKNGSHTSQPVLVRAGPGTGKTWMSKQAAYTLADQLGETATKDVHKGVRMVPVIMYIQQIVYVLRDTEAPNVADLLEVYLRKVYPEWHVATLLQAYELRALIMILDGVDEAAGMRQYIEDFVLRVLVPSGNRILITSRREGIADLTPYLGLYFTVLDLKELSNEQQRSVIRAQMDGNEFFDHVLALGEMRRGLDGVWSSKFTARERKELEGFFVSTETEEAAVEEIAETGSVGVVVAAALASASKPATTVPSDADLAALASLIGPALTAAIQAITTQLAEEGAEAPKSSFAAADDPANGVSEVVCSSAALVIALLHSLADGVEVNVAGGEGTTRLIMTSAVNKFVDLDVTHFRFALCTLALSVGSGATLSGIQLEVHHADVKAAAKGETHTAAEHYAFFRTRMAHLAVDDEKAIDRLLEPALIFLVDATGVPVLLSLLVLIFTSGGEDLSQLPKSQFELYQMGIQFAMDKRLVASSQDGAEVERGAALVYDDKAVTTSLVKRWNKLFALEQTGPVMPASTPRGSKAPQAVAGEGEGGKAKAKVKKEKVSRKATGLGLGADNTRDSKKEKSSVDRAEHFANEDLYEIFRQAAKYLGAAARGVGRKELNNIELQMPKHLRNVVTTLVEANLKVLRDGSMHDVGLVMLRNLAILNQQNGRRQFGAGDVSQALLQQLPCPEALTLWLHLNNEDGGIPLTKTLEMQTDLAEGQYQFKHLSFQEGLFSQYLIMQAEDAVVPGNAPMPIWETNSAASAFLCEPFMNNTCRISANILGSLLARQRRVWDFSSAPLTATGKRALWLLSNNELHELNLCKNNVGEDNDDSNEGLAKLLRIATRLTTLRLGDNVLGNLADEESGWRRQQISRALSASTSITELDLSRNDLRPPGVAVMCVALRALKTLLRLDISFNWPGRIKELPELCASHPTLQQIGIVEEAPTNVWQRVAYLDSRAKEKIGRTLLARAQPILGFLSCDAFSLGETTATLTWKSALEADAVLLAGVLRANTVVEALNFGGGNAGAGGGSAGAASGAADLRDDSKELIGNALLANTDGRVGLCDAFGLRPGLSTATYELNAKASKDAGGGAAGKGESKAEALVVRSVKTFVLLCGILRGNRSLVSLTLRSLKPAYCSVLAKALRGNASLQRLVLEFEAEGKKAGTQVSLDVQQLTGRQPIKRLDLVGSSPGGEVSPASELNNVTCTLVGLMLAENMSIEVLRINPGPAAEGGKIIEALHVARSSSLRTLDLSGVGLGDRGGPMIFASLKSGHCPMLTSLKLSANELNDRSLAGLIDVLQGEACALTSLDLSRNRLSGKRIRDLLMQNETLRTLDIRGQAEGLADDDDWSMIGAMLLKESYEGKLGNLSCDLFDLSEGLEELSLSKTNIGPGGRELLFGVLAQNGSLTSLKLASCGLDLDAAKQLAVAMARNECVTELDLSGNLQHASAEWIEAIAEAVGAHPMLVRVTLDGDAPLAISELRGESALPVVDFASKAIGELSAHVLRVLLATNSKLEELSLKANALGPASAEVIVSGLAAKASVTSLNLFDTMLGAADGQAPSLFAQLAKLTELRSLNLASNDLTDVPDALCRLAHLGVLNLHGNKLGRLPLAIGQLQHLRELTLQGNRLSRLPASLADCTHLEVLDARGNALQHLPPLMGKLVKLRRLELARNKLVSLPESMRESPESLQIDVTGNNTLQSPPFSLAKQGIQAIKRYFHSEAYQVGYGAQVSDVEQIAAPSFEHRKQRMRERGAPPPKADGAPSRHNWVKASESIVLLFNCHGAPCEFSGGDASALSLSEAYDLTMADGSAETIGHVKPGESAFLDRVEFNNAWARVEERNEESIGCIVHVRVSSKGVKLEPPVFLRVYPHTAYGCRVGSRCELREGGAHGTSTLGCATVQEILDDDRVSVRLDNASSYLGTADGKGGSALGGGTALGVAQARVTGTGSPGGGANMARRDSSASFGGSSQHAGQLKERMIIDLRPDTVVRTTLPQYRPGARLIVLHEGKCTDMTVQRCLGLPASKGSKDASAAKREEGTRHRLQLGVPTASAGAEQAAAAASEDPDAEIETLDLNKFNHCQQRQLPSGEWMTFERYQEAREAYCSYMANACSTIRDVSTGKYLKTELQEAACTCKAKGGGGRSEWSGVEALADVATCLTQPWRHRAQGQETEVQAILGVGRGFEQEWTLRQCIHHIIKELEVSSKTRTADEGSKTFVHKVARREPIRLLPVVISTRELVGHLKRYPEETMDSLLAEGRLCEWYLQHCKLIDGGEALEPKAEAQIRAMLLQAHEMRALIVVLDYDEHFSAALGMSLSRFVHGELLPSGNRLLLLCRPEAMVPSELDELEERFVVLSLRALQLNFTGTEMLDMDGARVLSAVTGGSVFSTPVSALHLGDNRHLGTESGKLMSELLKSKCEVAWLDLQNTGIDGRSLAFAIKMNSTLTYLDVRSNPLWDDAVLHAVGAALLENGCKSQLSYLRCDDFDLLPGGSTLSLHETALGVGLLHTLAALLRRNTELRELDLSATDCDDRGAHALAAAIEVNTCLTRLSLKHNHIEDEVQLLLQSVAGPGLELLL